MLSFVYFQFCFVTFLLIDYWNTILPNRRLQVQGWAGTSYKYDGGIARTMKQIVREEGVKGLYKGSIPNLAKVVPSVSFSFVIYEQMRKVLDM
jgi:solute carrier family 25 phosphate transporter 23/24/25/41